MDRNSKYSINKFSNHLYTKGSDTSKQLCHLVLIKWYTTIWKIKETHLSSKAKLPITVFIFILYYFIYFLSMLLLSILIYIYIHNFNLWVIKIIAKVILIILIFIVSSLSSKTKTVFLWRSQFNIVKYIYAILNDNNNDSY